MFRVLGCKSLGSGNDMKGDIGSPEDKAQSMFQQYRFLMRDRNSCLNMLRIAMHMIYNDKKDQYSSCNYSIVYIILNRWRVCLELGFVNIGRRFDGRQRSQTTRIFFIYNR